MVRFDGFDLLSDPPETSFFFHPPLTYACEKPQKMSFARGGGERRKKVEKRERSSIKRPFARPRVKEERSCNNYQINNLWKFRQTSFTPIFAVLGSNFFHPSFTKKGASFTPLSGPWAQLLSPPSHFFHPRFLSRDTPKTDPHSMSRYPHNGSSLNGEITPKRIPTQHRSRPSPGPSRYRNPRSDSTP